MLPGPDTATVVKAGRARRRRYAPAPAVRRLPLRVRGLPARAGRPGLHASRRTGGHRRSAAGQPLAALQASTAVLWYLRLGRLAAAAGRMLDRRRVQVWLDRVTAAVFVGFGVRVATETGR